MDNLTRQEAKDALLQGKKVRHKYYTPEEWLKLENGTLKTEDGCSHGSFLDEFWTKYQIFPDGWEVIN
ncbi:hypothetical protein [Pontibacter sp. H249]|uniref:hypothetical protein n=1 Tax=Pontibacter sp. H249 TaxID=3133420 RepID=UPI0030BF1850